MSYKLLTYNQSLALLTDLYQLTMAYGYWKAGVENKEGVFHLYFRRNPFKGGFAVACGLEYALDFLENFKFDANDLEYLESLKGNNEKPLFEKKFLDHLQRMSFKWDIDAIPEGTVVFPFEPLVRVGGTLLQCQILETALLNILNFQTLVATKAARLALAAQGEPILEFGLRRAQGIDGALAAARAAYIGGCAATSNVLAGKIFGIPVRGTHAHSWIMSFDSELQAFEEYAKAMPNNCVFLVDTYNSLEGVKKAVRVGKTLRARGYQMAGIRLDSGDLAYLSREARKMLDAAGMREAQIIASNELDERIIDSLKDQGAQINVWGVGTKLVTAFDEPALGGVYKLSAVREANGKWKHKIKLSEQAIKISNPGIQQVRRYRRAGEYIADVIFNEGTHLESGCWMIDPTDMTRQKKIPTGTPAQNLLTPVFRKGKRVCKAVPIEKIKQRCREELSHFHEGIKRFENPHQYPVGLEKSLFDLKTRLILRERQANHVLNSP